MVSKQWTATKGFLLTIAVFLIILLPRLYANDRFVSVDEGDWIKHGANFYYALGQRDFEETFRIYEPAYTTTIASGAAMLIRFPEYRGFGQGYFTPTVYFLDFITSKGVDPLNLLVTGRSLMILVISLTMAVIFIYLWNLVGLIPALSGILVLNFSPFFLGHSRLLTQEGLLSVLLLLSILAYIYFLTEKRNCWHILFSGFIAGVACLTKSPGIIIVPFIVLLTLLAFLVQRKETGFDQKELIKNASVYLLMWGVTLIAVYFILWPSMWVAPISTLKNVYGAAISVVTRGDQSVFDRVGGQPGFNFALIPYIRSFLWHSTPVEWFGLFAIVVAQIPVFSKRIPKRISTESILSVILILFSALYILMMSIGGAKRSSHYIMSSQVSLSLLAGIGIANLELMFKEKWKKISVITLTFFLYGFQIFSALNFFPY